MIHIEQVIKEAVEKGGYKNADAQQWISFLKVPPNARGMNDTFLDPSFWQALGKARGWREHVNRIAADKILGSYGAEWRLNWHRFIDKLVSGGTAEDFFAELI